jgi:hypothetical protein
MMTHTDCTAAPVDAAARSESDLAWQITGPKELAAAVPSNTAIGEDFLSAKEVATLIHVDPSTLRRWRNADPPAGPAFSRLSPGVVVYSIADVRHWISLRRIDPAECD